jgi:hypothetical protein
MRNTDDTHSVRRLIREQAQDRHVACKLELCRFGLGGSERPRACSKAHALHRLPAQEHWLPADVEVVLLTKRATSLVRASGKQRRWAYSRLRHRVAAQ